jgi:hypothetical protein
MKIIFLLLAAPVISIWNGYALAVLWGWFIVPVFHGPALRIPFAIGLSLIVGYMTHQTRKSEDDPDTGYMFLLGVIKPAVALLFGWIVTWFV